MIGSVVQIGLELDRFDIHMIGSVTEIDTAKSELSSVIDIAVVVDIGKVSFASVVDNVKESH
jgi:hypothetical protein